MVDRYSIVGRQVVYRAGYPGAKPEQGEVTSANAVVVFVRFSGSTSQACTPADLTFLDGKSVDQRPEEHRGLTHPNGRPMFSWSGTMLNADGTRSIFDDVDQ
ncbi:hypothetical protein G6L07_08240 [Agrobacterium rhizogenes]|nr:hypothetical protein [Rhizobium rhizogenes]